MRRFLLGALLLATTLAIAACGSPPAQTAAPRAVSTAAKPEAAPTGTIAATHEPPVTAMMAELQLAGEPYAAIGDPGAPLTVVEFSDYG